MQDLQEWSVLNEMWEPGGLLACAVAVAGVGLLGYLSGQALRERPDLPRQREMLWGARWGWAVFLVLLGLRYAGVYLGVAFTEYDHTAEGGSFWGLLLAIVVLARLFPWRARGLVYFESLEKEKRRERKQAKGGMKLVWKIGQGLLGLLARLGIVLLLVLLCVGTVGGYLQDRERIWDREQQVVGDAMRIYLQAEQVRRVWVFMADPVQDWVESTIFRQTPFWKGRSGIPNHLGIELKHGASQKQADELLEMAREGLGVLGRAERWTIAVSCSKPRITAEAVYDPGG